MTDWAIPQQAKLKYTQLFNLHDRSRSGFLSGVQCRDILMQSGLPRNTLAEIWNLSDIDGDGQLTREEFILAMHLTNQVRAGQALPTRLPPDLIPPSYRRQRSISSTSVHSTNSATSSLGSGVAASAATNDDLASHRSTETVGSAVGQGSALNSNSFEDKRRENFERGRAELERRRLKIIEQQTSILNEQLVRCKKQVAEAKSKIDAMRTERDTKAGLLTSLEAQLKTVRDRRVFLDHEEVQIIAIAKDLNLVHSAHSADLDQQATQAKQESISQMKEQLALLTKEKDETVKKSQEAQARLDELRKELKSVSEEARKEYNNYKEQISKAKSLRQQFAEETKSRLVDLDSAWGATGSASPFNQQSAQAAEPVEQSSTFPTATEDPWASSNKSFSADPFAAESNNNNSQQANDSFSMPSRDTSPKFDEQPSAFGNATDQAFSETPGSQPNNKMYRAIYAFDARNVDELTINPGDIIVGSEEVTEPGWLSGNIGERSGLFPEAYVEIIPSTTMTGGELTEAAPAPSLATNISSHQSGNSTASQQEPETIQEQKATSALPVVVKYRVIYAFEARSVDELNINPGDIITGVEGPHEPGWLMGELNGQRGLFPEAYVGKLAEAQTEPGMPATEQTGKSRAKKAEVATVIANYRALGQEQLNLEKGQLVLIRRKMDSGWWEGELQIKDAESNCISQDSHLKHHKTPQRRQLQHTDELDHLIGELISSEWDYVNDLRLCRSAYIFPLSYSFDVSQIFTNWNQLIQVHELSLTKLTESSSTSQTGGLRNLDYCVVFDIFQGLFSQIVELYIGFCSRQNESSRQLDAKMASDIRFKQLVSESQRKLRKLIEIQSTRSEADQDGDAALSAERDRAMRNSNLPLTSFLIKPMQRITKYELLFDRMLKISEERQDYARYRSQLKKLKQSAKSLCRQVNEACRLKEDGEHNNRRLRWCQSHIRQPSASVTPSDALHPRSSFSRSSMSSVDLRLSSSLSSNGSPQHDSLGAPIEPILFNSITNCLGQRKLIKAGSLLKLRSGRELVAFLFSDFLLLTQVKSGTSLRVEDVFKSERAQQAYFKFYRPPIMLEDIQMDNFDNEQLFQSLSCPSINSSSSSSVFNKEQESLLISFLDRQSGSIHNLLALSPKDKIDWTTQLSERVHEAQAARASQLSTRALKPARQLSVNDCIGRLFVNVLELTRITSSPGNQRQTSLADLNQSWERRSGSLMAHMEPIQKVCVRMQMNLYKRTQMLLEGELREVLPLSDEFQTNTVLISDLRRQPVMADMNESMSNLDVQRDKYKFEINSTQFMIAHETLSSHEQGQEYLDIELIDDSRFRETRQIGRKRINMDQLLGRGSRRQDSLELARKLSNQSTRSIQAIQPNRPVDMTFKLKPVATDMSQTSSPPAGRSAPTFDSQQKFNLKLKFHLQLFCDTTPDLI